MDNDDYNYDDEYQEEQESSSYSRKQPNNKSFDNGKKLIQKAKDGSLKEDYGKVKDGINKVKSGDKSGIKDIMDGTSDFRDKGKIEKTGDNIENIGDTIKNAGDFAKKTGSNMKNASKAGEKISEGVDKGAEAAKNAAKAGEQAAKATEAAGRATKAAGEATKTAGAATKTAGATASTAGDAVNTAGLAADATGVGAVVGVPLNVAGTAASVGGKATVAAGTATEAAGATTEAAGAATEAAGQAGQAAAKAGQAAASGVQTGAKFGKNANKLGTTFGDKLEKFGESAKETGEKVKQFGSKVKKVGRYTTSVIKTLSNPIKVGLIVFAIFILCILVFFSTLLEPLFGAMDLIKRSADSTEKYHNFLNGLGFENSIDAFYSELDYLDKHYDNATNQELLMATLFYLDVIEDKDVLDSETNLLSGTDTSDESKYIWGALYSAIEKYCTEATSETDEMGRVYTANKIFRLKDLTKHMVAKTGETNTAPLGEYLALNADIIGTDISRTAASNLAGLSLLGDCLEMLIKQLIKAELIILFPPGPLLDALVFDNTFFKIDELTNSYLETKISDDYEAMKNYFVNYSIAIEDIFSFFTDIVGLDISVSIQTSDSTSYSLTIPFRDGELPTPEFDGIDELIEAAANLDLSQIDISFDCDVEYEVYSYDEEAYKEYLTEHYLREMPEFRDYIVDTSGEIIDDRVDELYENMLVLSKSWEELNEEADESAMLNNVCIGNINNNIISQLHLPIDLNVGDTVQFSRKTAFGTSGIMHNGVDLNEESVGVTTGAPVYSIYNGVVKQSTASNNFPLDEMSGTGGWVKIEYEITYTAKQLGDIQADRTSKFIAYYGGLDPTSVPLAGTTVTSGQQIGVIGSAMDSEDGITPGLHFGFYDSTTHKFLNPINIFITCSESHESNGICTYDDSGGVVIEFPESVLQYNQTNYTVTCYSEELGFGITKPNPVNTSSEDYPVYKMWINDGARYHNGIAVMKVDGIDRYLAATTSKMGRPGDKINAKLENGEIIPIIIGDIKNYAHTGAQNGAACDKQNGIEDPGCYGHFDGALSVIEFEVDPNEYLNNPNGGNPRNWGQDWDVNQKILSITRYGSILGDNVRTGEICPYDPDDTPDDVGDTTNANGIINMRLDKFLERNKRSIDDYQSAIDAAINKSSKDNDGFCTRGGAVAVAYTSIKYMADLGARLPYFWGGEYSGGVKGIWGDSSCHTMGGTGNKTEYNQCGLDCAGYVGWILKTAGYNVPEFDITPAYASQDSEILHSTFPGGVEYVPNISTLGPENRLKPGDILFSDGHIMFIIRTNSDSYTIAHAAGKSDGILFGTINFNQSKRGIRMQNFYTNPSNCAR